MGMPQLQQPQADAITISDMNTQEIQTAPEYPQAITAGAEYSITSPDIDWTSPTQSLPLSRSCCPNEKGSGDKKREGEKDMSWRDSTWYPFILWRGSPFSEETSHYVAQRDPFHSSPYISVSVEPPWYTPKTYNRFSSILWDRGNIHHCVQL